MPVPVAAPPPKATAVKKAKKEPVVLVRAEHVPVLRILKPVSVTREAPEGKGLPGGVVLFTTGSC